MAARGVGLALQLRSKQIAVDDFLVRSQISREVFYFHFSGMAELFDFAAVASADEVAAVIECRQRLRGPAATALIDIWSAVLFGTAEQGPVVIAGEVGAAPSATRDVSGQLLVTTHSLLLRAIREGDLRCAENAYDSAVLLTRIMLTPNSVMRNRRLPSAAASERAITITAQDIGIRVRRRYVREYLARRLLLTRNEHWRIAHLDSNPGLSATYFSAPVRRRTDGKG
ncbi:hypothetical protein ACFYO1_01620 [Nocardia sp. NPDC006044]|uniref:hypothetical protein n=1 Tax=Nocardia sp. NPDC006044 TaxID=3364306 RepID=UPI003699C1AC